MKTSHAALIGAGIFVAAGLLMNGSPGALRDYAEVVGIFGSAGVVGGSSAAIAVRGKSGGFLRVVGSGLISAVTSGAFALIVGSVYFVLAYPYDGLSLVSGIFAGVESGVAGFISGAIIGARA